MFKRKEKRRNKDAFLSMENGEVIDSSSKNKEKKKKPEMIHSRGCDEFTEEELQVINEEADIFGGSFNTFSDEQEPENFVDPTERDMKASVFNILKFIFLFCVIAILGFCLYKASPMLISKVKEATSKSESSDSTNSSTKEETSPLGFIEQHKQNQEIKKLKVTMNKMNTFNDGLKQSWALLKGYCEGYSNNSYNIYIHDKNMESVANTIQAEYAAFLETEPEYETECDKALFEIYKQRYEHMNVCMEDLKDSSSYGRSSIIDLINGFIEEDNVLNQKEFDLLIENFNKYGISYEITENQILMME